MQFKTNYDDAKLMTVRGKWVNAVGNALNLLFNGQFFKSDGTIRLHSGPAGVTMGAQTPSQNAGFWAQITGYTAIGSEGSGGAQSNTWSYSWEQVTYVQQGTWKITPGGNSSSGGSGSGSGSGGLAYNAREANNSPSGVQGNSINVSNLGPGQNILPVQGNPVVWTRQVTTCALSGSGSGSGEPAGNTEYIFEYENAVGPCTGSGSGD